MNKPFTDQQAASVAVDSYDKEGTYQQELAQQTRGRLVHAVTEFDRRASTRKGYNPYALGSYLERVDAIAQDIANGASPRKALCAGLSDRLLDHCLKAIGEPPFKREELDGPVYYRPASAS